VLIGIAFLGYFSTGLSSFSNSLRYAQTTGTLEAMLTTPTSLSVIILSSSLWDYSVTTLRVVVYLLVGILFLKVDFSGGNYLAAAVVIALTVLSASSLGIIAASFVMVLKRGDPINWGVSTLTAFFGGVYYPVQLLPPSLVWISYLLPITYSLDAMRKALLENATWGELLPDLLALVAFAAVLIPLSLLAFRYSVHRAKVEGSLTQY
jgi:ABC-2 type transport system permease protein